MEHMRNIYSQPDALTALKTRLEALDRAGGRRVGAGVRAGSDDAFAPLATGVLHDLYAATPADAVVVMDHGKVVETGTPDRIFSAAETDRLRQFLSQVL